MKNKDKIQQIRAALQKMSRYEMWGKLPLLNTPEAEKLIFAIGWHESGEWQYLEQTNGPAVSYFQIEPATVYDLYDWVEYKSKYGQELKELMKIFDVPENSLYAIERMREADGFDVSVLLCRMVLLRDVNPLPRFDANHSLAAYAKRVWNTALGKAKKQDYFNGCEVYDREVMEG